MRSVKANLPDVRNQIELLANCLVSQHQVLPANQPGRLPTHVRRFSVHVMHLAYKCYVLYLYGAKVYCDLGTHIVGNKLDV